MSAQAPALAYDWVLFDADDTPFQIDAGRHAMGFDTCRYNPGGLSRPEGVTMRYEVASHHELARLLLGGD